MTQQITSADLRRAGLSRSFADHVIAGTRNVGVPLALWLLDNHKIIAGPLVGKSKAEVRLLRSMYEPRAPKSIERRVAANDVAPPPQEAAA